MRKGLLMGHTAFSATQASSVTIYIIHGDSGDYFNFSNDLNSSDECI